MILVTGGTGTVGSRLVERLIEDGQGVRVLSRDVEAARSRFGEGVEIAQGDFREPDSVRAALSGVDRVFLLTPSAPEPEQQLQNERTVIAAAREAGVDRVVKQSVLGAGERSPMRYGRLHRQAEQELEASGVAYTILRPAAFMQGFLESVSDGAIYTCAEDGLVAMVDARDIAAVAAAALLEDGHEGRTYTLTGPEALSYDEAAATLSAVTGRAIRHVRVPPEGVVEGLSGAGLPHWLAEDLAAQFGVFAAGGGAELSGDVAAVTGRAARSLEELARQELAGNRQAAHRDDVSRRSFIGGAAALGAAAIVPAVGWPDAAAARSEPRRGHRRGDSRRGRKVVLITGTSSGFGRLTALTLARQGHEVYASMRQPRQRNAGAARELRRLARSEGLALDVVDIDVRRERSVESGVRQVLRRAGRIDVLVNNAGIFYPALLETQTVAQIQEVFDTDVFGQLRMNRAALPAMRERGEGLIVQITSGVGRIAFPFQGAYNGAKWAMEAMAQASRYELSQSGVDVVIVEPAAYPTDFIDNARVYYRRYLRSLSRSDERRRREYGDLARRVEGELQEPPEPDPQEVADAVARLVRTPAGRRPLRTLVGEQVAALEEINAVHQRIQDEIMRQAGYGDLIGVGLRGA